MTAQRETNGLPAAAEPSPGLSEVEPGLLEMVVEQTVASLDEQSLAETLALPRMREIAQRYVDEALTVEPILMELIEAVLETHLPPLARAGSLKSKVVRAVSQTLFDNPVCRGRLELLWSQLLDSVS